MESFYLIIYLLRKAVGELEVRETRKADVGINMTFNSFNHFALVIINRISLLKRALLYSLKGQINRKSQLKSI